MIEVTIRLTSLDERGKGMAIDAETVSNDITIKATSPEKKYIGEIGDVFAECLRRFMGLGDIQDASYLAKSLNLVVLDLIQRYGLKEDCTMPQEYTMCTAEDIPW